MRHRIERRVQTQCPQHRDTHADGRAWPPQLQRRQCVAIDARFGGQRSDRPATANPRDADALAELGDTAGGWRRDDKIAH